MADTLDLGSSALCVRVQVSPPGPYAALVQLAERLLAKEKATGSSPVCCSKHHPQKDATPSSGERGALREGMPAGKISRTSVMFVTEKGASTRVF